MREDLVWEIVAAIFPALPSAMVIALGKATAIFFCFLLFHVNNGAYIYIRNHNLTQYIRNHIYISQTTNYVRNPQYITNHKFTSSIHKGMPT